MSKERWLDIPRSPGYQVSDLGRVRSVDRVVKTSNGSRSYKGKLLRPAVSTLCGHLSLPLGRRNGKTSPGRCVHELVALTFIGPRPKGYDTRHLDGDTSNNKSSNLKYGTRGQNNIDVFYHGRRRFTRQDILRIRSGKEKGVDLAKEYGVWPSAISAIKTKKNYNHVK